MTEAERQDTRKAMALDLCHSSAARKAIHQRKSRN